MVLLIVLLLPRDRSVGELRFDALNAEERGCGGMPGDEFEDVDEVSKLFVSGLACTCSVTCRIDTASSPGRSLSFSLSSLSRSFSRSFSRSCCFSSFEVSLSLSLPRSRRSENEPLRPSS
jgi:hypothetical protein